MECKYYEDTTEPKKIQRYATQYWDIQMAEQDAKKLKKQVQNLVDKRGKWVSALYDAIIKKMNYICVKGREVDTTQLQFEESLIAITDRWKKQNAIREEPIQKTIAEATMEKPFAKRAVKRIKKK